MLTKNILPVTEVKRELMRLLKKIQGGSEPVVITKEGRAAGVLMSAEDYEALMETLEILSDKNLLRSLRRAAGDFKAGRTFTHRQVFEE